MVVLAGVHTTFRAGAPHWHQATVALGGNVARDRGLGGQGTARRRPAGASADHAPALIGTTGAESSDLAAEEGALSIPDGVGGVDSSWWVVGGVTSLREDELGGGGEVSGAAGPGVPRGSPPLRSPAPSSRYSPSPGRPGGSGSLGSGRRGSARRRHGNSGLGGGGDVAGGVGWAALRGPGRRRSVGGRAGGAGRELVGPSPSPARPRPRGRPARVRVPRGSRPAAAALTPPPLSLLVAPCAGLPQPPPQGLHQAHQEPAQAGPQPQLPPHPPGVPERRRRRRGQ